MLKVVYPTEPRIFQQTHTPSHFHITPHYMSRLCTTKWKFQGNTLPAEKLNSQFLLSSWSECPGIKRRYWTEITSLVDACYVSKAETKGEVGRGFNLNLWLQPTNLVENLRKIFDEFNCFKYFKSWTQQIVWKRILKRWGKRQKNTDGKGFFKNNCFFKKKPSLAVFTG